MKTCEVCKRPFPKQYRWTKAEYEVRITCSTQCEKIYNEGEVLGYRKDVPVPLSKPCEVCTKTMLQPKSMSVKDFEKRKTCCLQCRAIYSWRTKRKSPERVRTDGDIVIPDSCPKCGKSTPPRQCVVTDPVLWCVCGEVGLKMAIGKDKSIKTIFKQDKLIHAYEEVM